VLKFLLSGPALALLTALLFGASVPLQKLLLTQVQPWMLAGLVYSGGGLVLLPIVVIQHLVSQPSNSLRRRDWEWLGASAVLGGLIAPILLVTGLTTTPGAIASLLLNFEGVFTALVAWIVFKERWTWTLLLGIVAITSGGVVLSHIASSSLSGFSWGALLILGTCLAWAIDSNCTNKIADRNPFQLALFKSGLAGVINVAIALAIGQSFPPLPWLLGCLTLGAFSTGLTYFCFVLALRKLGSARTGAYFALSPFAGALISILFLGEPVTQSLAIAAGLMGIGAWLCIQEPTG
jgi:drug/metabolite transporter (DMT)-like permease